MSNIVLLTAGGTGTRAHSCIPKQFISVNDKPIIVYTLEAFQKHPEIDYIVVTCLDGWNECLKSYAKQFGITKLKSIVAGGSSGFESILNGINEIKTFANDDDIVLIHDGNRPNVSVQNISECIKVSIEKGNAITVIPCAEVVFENQNKKLNLLDRDKLVRVQTPHGAKLKDLLEIYQRAIKDSNQHLLGYCSLLYHYNIPMNFIYATEKNFKITYPEDIELFKGLKLLDSINHQK